MAGRATGESRSQRVFRAGESRDVPANDIQGPVHFLEARIQLPRLRHSRFENLQIRRTGRGEVWRHLTRPASLQPADGVLRLTAPPSHPNGGEVGNADFDITGRLDLEWLRDYSGIVLSPILADLEVEGGTRGHGHDEADIQRSAGTCQVRREFSHRRYGFSRGDDDGGTALRRRHAFGKRLLDLRPKAGLLVHAGAAVHDLAVCGLRFQGAFKQVIPLQLLTDRLLHFARPGPLLTHLGGHGLQSAVLLLGAQQFIDAILRDGECIDRPLGLHGHLLRCGPAKYEILTAAPRSTCRPDRSRSSWTRRPRSVPGRTWRGTSSASTRSLAPRRS